MLARRSMIVAVALAVGLLFTIAPVSHAQRGGMDRKAAGPVAELNDGTCPSCNEKFSFENAPPEKCPHCSAVLESTKNKDGSYTFKSKDTEENKYKKYLLYGGGAVLVLGLIGMILKYTVFAPAPVKKKKKRRDEDDEDDDRPRKKRRQVEDVDDEDDRPRKKRPRNDDDE